MPTKLCSISVFSCVYCVFIQNVTFIFCFVFFLEKQLVDLSGNFTKLSMRKWCIHFIRWLWLSKMLADRCFMRKNGVLVGSRCWSLKSTIAAVLTNIKTPSKPCVRHCSTIFLELFIRQCSWFKVIASFYPNLILTILTLHFITISYVSCTI